jgi:hypothetical protein
MTDNQKRVLEMLAEGKISVDDANRLLSLVGDGEGDAPGVSPEPGRPRKPAKYLRIQVHPQNGDPTSEAPQINIRVPMALLRAGVKLTALIPSGVAEKANEAMRKEGIDFDLRNLKPEDLEPLVDALSELEVDVKGDKEKIHIFVE